MPLVIKHGFARKAKGVITDFDLLTPRPPVFHSGSFNNKKGNVMKKTAIAVIILTITSAAYADDIIDINCECECDKVSDINFYISAGFDILAKTHEKIDVAGYGFHNTQKYKFDAPNISAGIDFYGIGVGANMSWRDADGLWMRNITSVLEIPILPFGITPYAIGEIGITDVKFNANDIKLHDRAFMYGGGVGMRVNMSDNTFIKIYEIWSRTRLHDTIDDKAIKISAQYRRMGISLGYLF